MRDLVVAKEVAEDDFDRMCEAVDLETDDFDAEDQAKFDGFKARIVRGVCRGQIVISEVGLPTVTLKYPVGEIQSVAFRFPTGGSLEAIGDTKKTNNVTKGWKVLEDLTGVPSSIFGKMRTKPDLAACEALVALFLG